MTNWKGARKISLLIIWAFLRDLTLSNISCLTYSSDQESCLNLIPGILMNGNNSVSYQFPTSWLHALKMFNQPETRDTSFLSANPNNVSAYQRHTAEQSCGKWDVISLMLHTEPWHPHWPRTCYRQGLGCQKQVRVFPTRGRMNINRLECYTCSLKAKVTVRKKAKRCTRPTQSHEGMKFCTAGGSVQLERDFLSCLHFSHGSHCKPWQQPFSASISSSQWTVVPRTAQRRAVSPALVPRRLGPDTRWLAAKDTVTGTWGACPAAHSV